MSAHEQIRRFLITNFYLPDPTVLTDETSLLQAGVIDSTGVLEVIAFLEETFALKVEEAETTPENLDSIALLSAYVTRKSRSAHRADETSRSASLRGEETQITPSAGG